LGRVEEVLGGDFCRNKIRFYFLNLILAMNNLNDILKLPIAERILAVEAIWDSIAAENKEYPLSDDEYNMLEERSEEYKKNPGNVKTWDEVKANIFKRF
jgi:putative addiction module component (TIGR02574 family)